MLRATHPTDLPPGAAWFFLAAPPSLALLFDPACAKTVDNVARATVAITLYTVVTGLAVHVSFNAVGRWLSARAASLSAHRWLLTAGCFGAHAAVITAVVVVATLAQHGLLRAIYPSVEPLGGIAWRGVLVALAYVGIASIIGRLQRVAIAERVKAERDRTAALEARLAVLQAQMQPHFLFNSLNVCAGLIQTQPDIAEATLDKLAGFLRYALESTSRKAVSLREELRAVRAYLDVQRERFGERLRYEISAPDEGEQLWLPPLLLQPLVENALVHGLSDEEGGVLRITVLRAADRWTIDVLDSGGRPARPAHPGSSTGQQNVAERLRLVFGDGASLHLRAPEGGGYLARVSIPVVASRALAAAER
ncbi:MAG: histidine kinase [Polyangiaceae bacterium]